MNKTVKIVLVRKFYIIDWLIIRYNKVVNSIAFIPAILTVLFLFTAALMISFDFSEAGKDIKRDMDFLRLRDASTARAIIQAIVAGIISLAVFSFTMVMVILNQAASNMSNRILDKLIGNRFQQTVLGIYIGTIVYGLFLLSSIRDIDSGVYIPALSIYVLMILTVLDIFLFIYFLHYVTRSIKYSTIIKRVSEETKNSIRKNCLLSADPGVDNFIEAGERIPAKKSAVFQGFNTEALLALSEKHDLSIHFPHEAGSFILAGMHLFSIQTKSPLSSEVADKLYALVYFERDENIALDYKYGFRQLMEIAVKALSPGINDPGTAVEALRSMIDLLMYRAENFPHIVLKDKAGNARIFLKQTHPEEIFNRYVLPVWDYGKNDRLVANEFIHILKMLMERNSFPAVNKLYQSALSHGNSHFEYFKQHSS